MPTTLITGASSGIGYELAKLFAADGDDVVLVARSEGKLHQLAAEIQTTHHVKTTIFVSDLSEPDAADILCQQLDAQQLSIDTLVNNAGFGELGDIAQISVQRQTDMVMLNVLALTKLTRMLLPSMIQRRYGGVLNVGSIAAYQAGPHMTVYYASKAYVLSFTEGLREEVLQHGLHVTCLAPGPTQTGFGSDSGMGTLKMFSSAAMSAEAVARAGHDGYRNNHDVVIPGWKNCLIVLSTALVPRWLTRKLVARMQSTK